MTTHPGLPIPIRDVTGEQDIVIQKYKGCGQKTGNSTGQTRGIHMPLITHCCLPQNCVSDGNSCTCAVSKQHGHSRIRTNRGLMSGLSWAGGALTCQVRDLKTWSSQSPGGRGQGWTTTGVRGSELWGPMGLLYTLPAPHNLCCRLQDTCPSLTALWQHQQP